MINDDHLKMLAASRITPEFATARGYETIVDSRWLAAIGIVKAARGRVPGLLIPLLRRDGSTWGYQYRPDEPRLDSKGRPIKYETPWQQHNGLDVPPGVGPMLADPAVPVWVTEGTKKADCGAIHGLCIVALSGVWNWLTTNSAGGKTALPDWYEVALNNRRVIIAFDGDVARKESVQRAAHGLANYLASKGARVEYLWLPDTDNKTGLDDYLVEHSVEELFSLVKPTQPPPPTQDPSSSISRSDSSATPQQPSPTAMPSIACCVDILGEVATRMRRLGLVGEERLAKTVYLAVISRLLDAQVSVVVKGHSASGKSRTVATVLRFFPDEAYLEFTAMSERALVYSPETYSHRTLVVFEATALREGVEDDMTSYFVRTLLSEGRIVYPVTIRDPKTGTFSTHTVTKEGPTNLVFTTTKTQVHAENETRILSLTTDDSAAQTARVFAELASERPRDVEDLEDCRNLQRWLAGAEHRVTVPYAEQLVGLIPPIAVRMRRDVGQLLALIRAHAVLHQASRERDQDGRIVATLDDYAVVRDLVADLMAEGVGATVPETVRRTVEAVAALNTAGLGVTANAVAAELGLDKSNASRRLRRAADGGYLRNREEKRGKPARWEIGDPLPETMVLLPDTEVLRNAQHLTQHSDQGLCEPEQECCAVALESEGERDGYEGHDEAVASVQTVLGGRVIDPGESDDTYVQLGLWRVRL